jgi:hypothetical protein
MNVVEENKTTVLVEVSETSVVSVAEVLTVVEEKEYASTVVTENTNTLYHQSKITDTVVSGGIQGPPGVPGASTQFEYHTAGETLGGNRAVTLGNTGLTYPGLSSPNSFVLGLTTSSASLGELVEVQITGTQTEPSWAWNVGLPVFVGTNGVLTQTPPTSGQTLIVGWAATPTKVVIDKQTPIFME